MTPGAKFSRKGTKLSVLDWPVNHPFTKTFYAKPSFVQRKGTNPPINIATDIQSLINEGEIKVPTWYKKSTNLLHKKIVYLLSILALCSEPISLNDLMKFMNYNNRKTFRDNYLIPLRKAGLIDMSEKKNDPEQKYFLSESGKAFLGGINQ